MEIGEFLLGVAIFVGVLHLVNRSSFRTRKRIKTTRNPFSKLPIEIKAATIADDMLPLVSPLVKSGGSIVVIGNDGCYIHSKNGDAMVGGFETWLSSGCRVAYVLLDPNREALSRLANLVRQYPEEFELFVGTLYDENGNVDESGSKSSKRFVDLKARYGNFHPTLIWLPQEKKGMWLEGFHPRGSVFAYKVRYYSPNAMNSDSFLEFEKIDGELNELRESCTRVDQDFLQSRLGTYSDSEALPKAA